MPFLEFNNVDYSYPTGDRDFIQALYSVSLTVERGEFVALVGTNGSGKSTLARLANGLYTPDRGFVTVDGLSTGDKANLYDIRKKIGVVFQNPDNQTVTTVVEDDVAFGPENLGLAPTEIRERVDWALDCVGMREYAKSNPARLSGGQKQRVAIAGVLALKPELMILDEATGMLDPEGRAEVMDVVTRLNRDEGMTVIMITHFMEEAAAAKRIVILKGGKVTADGTDLFETPDAFTAAGLELPFTVRLAQKLKRDGLDLGTPLDMQSFVDSATKIFASSDGACEKITEGADIETSAPVIVADKLSYVYSPKTPFMTQALHSVDLTVNEGDFFGIIGSTGAGKSTLVSHFNALTRVQKKSGNLTVNGMDLTGKKLDLKALRATVGMVFQYPEHQLFDDTVEKDVAFGPKNLGLGKDEQAARAREAIELVGLDYDTFAKRSPFELSGGQKRRVAIAGVIAMHPKILVLDEPTAGLDPLGKREIMELVVRIKSEVCPTVVMISHNMDEIASYCNRIAVMQKGVVAGVYTPRELFGSRETIEKCGVKLPLVTELASRLCAAGLPVDPATLSEDELVEQLKSAEVVNA